MSPYIFFLRCLFPFDSISWPSFYFGNSVVFRATSTCPQNPRLASPTCTHTQLLKEEKQSRWLMSLNHHHCHAHSLPTIVPPSNSLPCWLADTKQTCYILSLHDTPKKNLLGFWDKGWIWFWTVLDIPSTADLWEIQESDDKMSETWHCADSSQGGKPKYVASSRSGWKEIRFRLGFWSMSHSPLKIEPACHITHITRSQIRQVWSNN